VTRRAVFLDRDGTLVEPRHYPSRPQDLKLIPGVAAELRDLRAADYKLIVITNQSGLARGLFTEIDLELMHQHLADELRAEGVELDAIYYCPHHVDGIVPHLAIDCDCRKPRPGLLKRAAIEEDVDLERSWFVGDILDDVEAGRRAGCRTVLVDLGTESLPADPWREPDYVARDTVHALRIVRFSGRAAAPIETDYRPASWREPVLGGVHGSH